MNITEKIEGYDRLMQYDEEEKKQKTENRKFEEDRERRKRKWKDT